MPASAGSAATASSPARRETALLTPEATPLIASSTASSTAVVNGATVSASPRPNTTTPANTPVGYPTPASIRDNHISPAAATSGPSVIGSLGPMRAPSSPAAGDRTRSSTVTGTSAEPASSAE